MRNRLVTLSGPGGAGKTRLAVEVARVLAKTSSYVDGLWMVDLSGSETPSWLLRRPPRPWMELTLSGSRPTVAALTAQLATRELVVVLDNCEHVIDAAAALVRAIMNDCLGITILTTSREPLHLPGEIAWRVPSLRLPDQSDCGRAESLDPDRGEPIVGEPSKWFLIERENLRIALANALEHMPQRALRAAVAAWRSWMASGMHAEGLQWLRRALAASPEVSSVHVRALFATAVFEARLGRIMAALPLGRSIAEIGRHDKDPVRRAAAAHLHCVLAWLAGGVGHHRPTPRRGRGRSS